MCRAVRILYCTMSLQGEVHKLAARGATDGIQTAVSATGPDQVSVNNLVF
jgi:hypothetical protein